MYLSDLFVVAHKRGGEERIESLFDTLLHLPSDFWEHLGGYQWLLWAKRKYDLDRESFYADLKKYGDSQEWTQSEKSLGEYMGFDGGSEEEEAAPEEVEDDASL